MEARQRTHFLTGAGIDLSLKGNTMRSHESGQVHGEDGLVDMAGEGVDTEDMADMAGIATKGG